MMLGSLRSRLVLSHFIVILMAFLLTAIIASVPIRRVQEARLRNSLVLSSESVARQIDLTRTLTQDADLVRNSTQIEFAQRAASAEQQRSGNRILIVNQDGRVIVDSSPTRSYEGETIPTLVPAIDQLSIHVGNKPPPARLGARIALVVETYSVPAGELDGRRLTVAATGASASPELANLYFVAWAPRRAAPLIDDFVRPLAIASIVALGVSVVIGLLISRSITGPLQRLTTSVDEINSAGLDERIKMESGDEVGTLVSAFNQMLDRLASTYDSQRELLANIAHELRTPLTSIQGYTHALRDDVIHDADARQDALQTIADEARRMTELVEQILQLSRLESGQLPVRFTETVIGEVLSTLERQFALLVAEQGVRLSVDRESELRCVVDPELLTQALGNLINNAVRHTGDGGVVEVRATRISSPSRPAAIRIVVTDTGEGMSETELEHIFGRFYRSGGRSSQHDVRNFGLGLSIVQEIVNRHRGEISVESTPGVGTAFTIELPVNQDAANS